MGFHGYGHNSCIIGDCSIADCPEGPQMHYHKLDSATYSHDQHHLRPNRSVVPRHRNDGPVDLSKYCTPTGQGTWSIGGQRAATQTPSLLQIQANSNQHVTRTQPKLEPAVSSTMQTHATSVENKAPVEETRLYQSTPNVMPPKFPAERKDAKDYRSNSGSGRSVLEKQVRYSDFTERAVGFSLAYRHKYEFIILNNSEITRGSEWLWLGYGGVCHNSEHKTTNWSAQAWAQQYCSLTEWLNYFSRGVGCKSNYWGSLNAPKSCCGSDRETPGDGKGAV